MEVNNVEQVLGQMRVLAAKAAQQAEGVEGSASAITNTQPAEFSNHLKSAIDKVNEVSKEAGELKKAYELGTPNVDLIDVMVASQKAGLAFQAMVQVRNKLVESYRSVMNMPI